MDPRPVRTMYRSRGLEPTVLEAMSTSAVVVIEGARAVGKTTLVRQLAERRSVESYASLTDSSTRAAAEANLPRWLASRKTPAVIDEAQLLPELPLALKELVDRRGDPAQFILTGSAAIGRTGLGGSDPLTGRQLRMTLRPMTAVETMAAANAPCASLVDDLFDGTVRSGQADGWTKEDLVERIVRGGFPAHVLPLLRPTARALRAQVRADVTSTLSETVLDGERFDVFRAQFVLDALVSSPGGILNVTALGRQLELDRRTIDRYIDVLRRRFLIHELPNLATRPRSQRGSRTKVYPVDTAVAAESLQRAGRSLAEHTELMGQAFEALVVNELLAHGGWASTEVTFFYWRDTTTRGESEVDLVMVDAAGRMVGVEVKASSSIGGRDARGLHNLQQQNSAFHRGFVVYSGDEVVQLDRNIWAIPASFLSGRIVQAAGPSAIAEPASQVTHTRKDSKVKDVDGGPAASVFVSYTHADNDYDDGAILQFARRLAAAYEFLHGESLKLFTDRDIRWGEEWSRRLRTELEQTTFLLAFVTPSYLRSRACQDEVLKFSQVAQGAGNAQLLLPLIWTAVEGLSTSDDPVASALARAQLVDVSAVRLADPTSAVYRQAVEDLSRRLHDTVRLREEAAPSTSTAEVATRKPGAPDLDDDQDDLLSIFERIDESAEPLANDVEGLVSSLQDLSASFDTAEPAPSSPSPRMLRAWAGRLADKLSPSLSQVVQATDSLREDWAVLDGAVSELAARSAEIPALQREELREQLAELSASMVIPGGDTEVSDMRGQMVQLGQAARQLRPLARTFSGALDAMFQVKTSAAAWSASLG